MISKSLAKTEGVCSCRDSALGARSWCHRCELPPEQRASRGGCLSSPAIPGLSPAFGPWGAPAEPLTSCVFGFWPVQV